MAEKDSLSEIDELIISIYRNKVEKYMRNWDVLTASEVKECETVKLFSLFNQQLSQQKSRKKVTAIPPQIIDNARKQTASNERKRRGNKRGNAPTGQGEINCPLPPSKKVRPEIDTPLKAAPPRVARKSSAASEPSSFHTPNVAQDVIDLTFDDFKEEKKDEVRKQEEIKGKERVKGKEKAEEESEATSSTIILQLSAQDRGNLMREITRNGKAYEYQGVKIGKVLHNIRCGGNFIKDNPQRKQWLLERGVIFIYDLDKLLPEKKWLRYQGIFSLYYAGNGNLDIPYSHEFLGINIGIVLQNIRIRGDYVKDDPQRKQWLLEKGVSFTYDSENGSQ